MGTPSWSRVLTSAGLLAATTRVILLGREVRSLRSETRLENQRQQYMLTGMYVPRLKLSRPGGQRVIIGEPPTGTREILFIYDSNCGFSRANVLPWDEIAEEAGRRAFDTYALSLNDAGATAQFSADHSLGVEALLLEGDRAKTLLRAQTVPQTMVVDPNGLVVLARPGVLSRSATDSSECFDLCIQLFPEGEGTGFCDTRFSCCMCATR
jgi:hypothetical protein